MTKWKKLLAKNANESTEATLSNQAVPTHATEPARFDATRKHAPSPATYRADAVPFVEAPTPLVAKEVDEGCAPVRLVLDTNVAPGARPVVVILDDPHQPVIYHIPTKNHPPTKAESAEETELVVFHSASYPTTAK